MRQESVHVSDRLSYVCCFVCVCMRYTYLTHTGRVAVNSVCNQSGYQMQENVYHCILSVRKNSFHLRQCFHMTFGLNASYYSAVSCN